MTSDDFLDAHLALVSDGNTTLDQLATLRDLRDRVTSLLAAGAQPTVHDVLSLIEKEQARREQHLAHIQNTLKGTS